MSGFLYTLAFNPVSINLNSAQVHVFIEKNRDVSSWYIPFHGNYLLKSSLSLTQLVPSFRALFGSEPFMMTYAIPSLTAGSLPQVVWDWVNEDSQQVLSSS